MIPEECTGVIYSFISAGWLAETQTQKEGAYCPKARKEETAYEKQIFKNLR